jgi:hypothetical protein
VVELAFIAYYFSNSDSAGAEFYQPNALFDSAGAERYQPNGLLDSAGTEC